MVKQLESTFKVIDAVGEKSSKAVSLLIFLIMIITTVEVAARYVFNHPTIWAWGVNRQLFGIFILFAGIYAMHKEDHIKVEILYDHFSPRMKKIVRLITAVAFLCFMVTLVLQGLKMGWNSLVSQEKLTGAFPIPLYPLKLLIPVAAFLFLLEGLVVFLRSNSE
jgi:TRAP-type mannitol/chloroaromatic compound transport system permease small subunit